jgi:polyphosphate kinase
MCLVVRGEEDGIRRYVHLGTGNYNPATARLYTDMGLLTCRADFGEDAAELFNLLTGIGRFQSTRKLLVSPYQLHGRILELIQREAENARNGRPARIIAKMNALLDREVIEALYRASQAGVKIDLLVRGICCLRPQLPGLSDLITVRSVVDRFLEHSRIYYFENGGEPEIFLGSPDWMPRNFFRRIEAVFPVEDRRLRERVKNQVLGTCLADNVKSWQLRADATYALRRPAGGAPRRSQAEFMALAGGR